MPAFRYEARDRAGAALTGQIMARNRAHALVLLRQQGLTVDLLVEAREYDRARVVAWGQGPLYSLWPIRPSSLALFFDQLGRLLSAGVTPYEAFVALQDRVGGRLRRVAKEGAQTFARGGSISAHLERYPRFFPPHIVAIFRAGERSGRFAEACREIVVQCETDSRVRRHVTLLKAYVALVGIPALLVPSFPRVISASALADPNRTTIPVGLHGIYEYLRPGLEQYWRHVLHDILPWVIAAYVSAKVVAFVLHLPCMTAVRDRLALYTPILASHTQKAAVARFTRVLELMQRAGVPLGDSIREAAAATGNRLIAERIAASAVAVDHGGRMTNALRASGLFSPSQLSLLATAEETGTLDDVLTQLADKTRQEREHLLRMAGIGGCVTAFALAGIVTLIAAIAGWTTIYQEIYKVFESPAWTP